MSSMQTIRMMRNAVIVAAMIVGAGCGGAHGTDGVTCECAADGSEARCTNRGGEGYVLACGSNDPASATHCTLDGPASPGCCLDEDPSSCVFYEPRFE